MSLYMPPNLNTMSILQTSTFIAPPEMLNSKMRTRGYTGQAKLMKNGKD
jgi:hypothetical protein